MSMCIVSHPLLVPWLRKSRAIPLNPLWAVRLVQRLTACTRAHFLLYVYSTFVGYGQTTLWSTGWCSESLYRLQGPEFEPRCGRHFPHSFRPAPMLNIRLCNEYRSSFPGVRRPRHGVNHPPPSSADVEHGWSYTSSNSRLCLLSTLRTA